MKLLISLLLLVGFTAHADIGDKYSIAAKIGRVSQDLMLAEIIGMTVTVPNDAGTPVNVIVKAQLDVTQLADGTPLNDFLNQVFSGVRDYKLTLQIVYDPANVSNTAECLGADFEVLDTTTTGNLTDKACFSVQAKDIIIK
jgi:hypothetical protein